MSTRKYLPIDESKNQFAYDGAGNILGLVSHSGKVSSISPQYSSIADRPSAADFGIGRCQVFGTAYQMDCISDGLNWTSNGNSPSAADRPAAAMADKGTWRVGLTTYANNGTALVDQAVSDNTFVLFGDSITANCNINIVTPTIVSRSGTTVTVTSGTHLMQVGKKVKVANLMPDDFNGIVTAASIAATSWTYEKAGTQGNAVIAGSTHPSTGVMDIKDLTNLAGNGMWVWVNGLMGGNLELVFNAARGGWKASYTLEHIAELEADITATGKRAANAYVAMGINDIINGASADSVITALIGLINHNKSYGRRVFLDTIKPLGASHPAYSVTTKATIALVNNWIINVAPNLISCIAIDTYTPCLNPATGAAKVGLLGSETIHPNVSCQIDYIAPAIAAVFSKYITTASILPASIGDTYGASPLSLNLNDIGPWATTSGGTLTGNVLPGTGGICAGIKIAETGTASASNVQINTNAAGYVEQQFDLSGTVAANDNADLTITGNIARFAAGDKVRLCLHVELSNLNAANGNIKSFGAYVVIATAAGNGYYQIIEYTGTSAPFTGVSAGTKTYDLLSEEWEIPAGLTAFNLHVKLTGAGALGGSPAVVKVSRIGFISKI